MTVPENVQRIKNEALNKIVQIYDGDFVYSNYSSDGSYAEQRDSELINIIRSMKEDLVKARNKRYV